MNNIKYIIRSAMLSKRITTNKILQYCNESTESKAERILGFINSIYAL